MSISLTVASRTFNLALLIAVCLTLSACGGSNSTNTALVTTAPITQTLYTIGGKVTGLTGTLVLQNNAGDNLSLSANGAFTFATALTSSSNYNVSVLTQPNAQTCTVKKSRGSVSAAVTTIAVNCFTPKAWGAWGTEAAIHTDVTGMTTPPEIAFDANGNALAVWTQPDATSTTTHIMSNYYTAGIGWGTATLIETHAVGADAAHPQVAFEANGNAFAVWKETVIAGGKGGMVSSDILSKRYVAGTGWDVAAVIISDKIGLANDVQIAVDASGNALAVWHQSDKVTGNRMIVSNRYAAIGGWGTAASIDTSVTTQSLNPKLAFDLNGNALVVWQSVNATFNNYDLWSNRYSASTGWGAPVLVSVADALTSADLPQIALDSNGNALAVWEQPNLTNFTAGVIASSRYVAGSGWSAPTVISDSAVQSNNAQIAVDANGNAIAMWEQVNGLVRDVMSKRYALGTGWDATAVTVSNHLENAFNQRLAFDANGYALVVWEQSGALNDIHASQYVSGLGWGAEVLIETQTDQANFPQIAIDANGNAFAVWQQWFGNGTYTQTLVNRFQ